MRSAEPSSGGLSCTVWLLIVIGCAFFLQAMISHSAGGQQFVGKYLALSLNGVGNGFIWQFLTFQFLHGGLFHIIINCLIIYLIGRHVEASLGGSTFLKLYLFSGIVGGLLQMMGAAVMPGQFGGGVIGASAGAFGLVAAFAAMNPERPLTALVALIIPITMRAKYLLLLGALISVVGMLAPKDPNGGGVAHAAHLGGLVGGMGFVYWLGVGQLFPQWNRLERTRRRRPDARVAKKSAHYFWRRPKSETVGEDSDLPSAEFIRKEVDPILEKISAHGIHSLTERERRILDAARDRMSKR